MIWHNRLKYVHRVRVLHAFHTARNGSLHCTMPIMWKKIKTHCCGEGNLLGTTKVVSARVEYTRGYEGRGHARYPGHAWPLYFAVPSTKRCERSHPSPRGKGFELKNKQRWKLDFGIELEPSGVPLNQQA